MSIGETAPKVIGVPMPIVLCDAKFPEGTSVDPVSEWVGPVTTIVLMRPYCPPAPAAQQTGEEE